MRWLRRWRFRRQVAEVRPLDLDEVIGPLLWPDLGDQRQVSAMPHANQQRYAGAGNTGRHWRSLLVPNLPGALIYRGEYQARNRWTLP